MIYPKVAVKIKVGFSLEVTVPRQLALLAVLALGLGLALAAAAAETPAAPGLQNPPEMQDAVSQRAPQAPAGPGGGAPPGRTLGQMPPPPPPPNQLPAQTGPQGQETPESFLRRHRLHPGASGGQASRDVMLNQRLQGQGGAGQQRLPAPAKITPPAPAQPPALPPAAAGAQRLPMSEQPAPASPPQD